MRVLIVGLGSIARKHIEALKKIDPDVELFAFRKQKPALEYDTVINLYRMEEIPDNIDFVIISNPTHLHYQTIQDFIPLGYPLFIEKPVLCSLENSSDLVEKIKHRCLKTYVACNLRFHPAICFLKKELRIRKPLEFNSYCGSYLPDWRPEQDYRKNYSASKELGGGVDLDLIHEIDFCYYLFGEPANMQKFASKKSRLEINSNDIAHYVLEYQNTSAFITLNYYRRDAKRNIECVWDDETWYIDLLRNKIVNHKNETVFEKEINNLKTYSLQMEYFINCLVNGIKPMNDFEEALITLQICLNE